MDEKKLPQEILKIISAEFAYRHQIVPVHLNNGTLEIGHAGTITESLKKDLEFVTSKKILPIILSEDEVLDKLKKHYGEKIIRQTDPSLEQGVFKVVEKEKESEKQDNGKIQEKLNDSSVINFVNKMITQAIDCHASDIHIEAYEDQFRVRYRLDGVLQEVMNPPIEQKYAIIARLKIMADLDIAEKRRPQDGRIRVKRGKRVIDIRVSTLPTDFGEKIVLRILDKTQLNLDLDKLGFEKHHMASFKKSIESPYGMILVTGPTGSGKTTTLYATLNYLNTTHVNVITIEDPIEYNLTGINQSQVRSDIGFTFANALRAFLRQDPDIIMVGEIRDPETTEIAIRAALTGHLVFSTLHTNNAADTLTRLLDMGQEPFLISSSVKMVIAQRLLRTICPHCKIIDPKPNKIEKLSSRLINKSRIKFYKGEGCKHCNKTGYLGRTAVFEVLPITSEISDAINRKANASELRKIACKEGMFTLQQSALQKLEQGLTTIEEVLRETEI